MRATLRLAACAGLFGCAAAPSPPTTGWVRGKLPWRPEPHPELVEIRPSLIPQAGRGLFAREDIPKHTYLGDYTGEIVDRGEHRALLQTEAGAYLFAMPDCVRDDTHHSIAGDAEHYISKVNFAPGTINGQVTDLQNAAFGAGCAEPFIFMTTTRDIEADEEIYADYGTLYDYGFMERAEVQAYFLGATGIDPAPEFSWNRAARR